VEADRADDRRPVPVEALERMLPVPGGAVGHTELLAQRLEIEGMKAGDVLRLPVREVVEDPGADDPEPAIQRVEILPQGRTAGTVVKLVGVEPEPPGVL